MPTKRNKVSHDQAPQVSPTVLSILSEGLFAPPEGENDRERIEWKYFTAADAKQKILEQCKVFILTEWVRQRPGTRPAWWWSTEAPEKTRRRLGGIGVPMHERFPAYVPIYECGVPVIFHADDPSNPPAFESEAAYLKRHGLLTPEETRRLRKKDFEPEVIED